MNGWAGDVQVMHVIPVRYQRLYRTPWFKQLAAWISPRLATYLLLEKSRLRRTPSRRVVAVSALIAQQLHASYGPDLPVVTIPPGVTLPPATDPLRRAATRARLGWSDDTQACLLVARDPLRKGLHTLLNALAQLPAHYQLLVVGADAASRKRLRASPSLATRVTLLPPSTQVPLYFEAADIYVHPTLNDSYGMAPLEAMAHRLPVVLSAAPYCGLAQYLRPDEDALLLPDPHDAVQLAQAIVRIGSDTALRARLIANGLGVARENSWEKVAASYEALYAELLAQRSQAVLDASI
jgi:UDP-glucose:(heptosyl)LPS alpha-1,3-glucosyltransferase